MKDLEAQLDLIEKVCYWGHITPSTTPEQLRRLKLTWESKVAYYLALYTLGKITPGGSSYATKIHHDIAFEREAA